ncbi:glycosyltransferase family 4 protein [Verrucomicrobiota bacterium sgz303538]
MPDTTLRTILMTADTVGGVWTYAMELARGLSEHDIRVIVATMGEPMSADQRVEAASIRGLRVVESSYKLEWMQDPWEDVDAAVQWLLELEHHYAPEVVHLNGFSHGSLPWRAPALVVGHSCVLSWWQAVKGECAPSEWDEYRRRVRAGLQRATMVTAPTQAMLEALNEHYGALPASRVLLNGRSHELFAPSENKEPFIFAAGRLGDDAKNIRALGDAADGLAWPVFVAGADRDASGAQTLPANVEYCGRLAPSMVAQWMSRASIYCLPARYEPFGLSILEAALSGCALVISDIPTLRELWDGCAQFVPPNDSSALNQALHALIENPSKRTSLASAARERGLRFSRERFVEGYLETYRELLTTRQRSHSLAA